MEAVKKEVYYTLEDIYELPDGKRAELIDGEMYMMAPPGTRHQRLVQKFTYEIESYIRQHNGECEVFPAPFAVFLNKDDITYVEPDISVICDSSKLDEKGCHGAPDWIIEIVSPRSKQMDYFKKLFVYRAAGVKEYWIVDPIKEIVVVYQFEKQRMEQYSFGEEIYSGIYENFTIKI